MTETHDKKIRILDAAAEMFSEKPFHKVLLSDIASKAAVGKGTLYLYFKNKDDLFLAVLFHEFSQLVTKLRTALDESPAPAQEQLCVVIDALVGHLKTKAQRVELLGEVVTCPKKERTDKLSELWSLIESIIRKGIAQGVFQDENPALSARYIAGMVRSVSLYRPEGMDTGALSSYTRKFVLKALSPDSDNFTTANEVHHDQSRKEQR